LVIECTLLLKYVSMPHFLFSCCLWALFSILRLFLFNILTLYCDVLVGSLFTMEVYYTHSSIHNS
jgi:hypothetical protein